MTSARVRSFPLYDETATVTSTRKVKGGGLFDIGGAYRVWGKNLLAGVTFHAHVVEVGRGRSPARIPDPVFFDRPRAVNTTSDRRSSTPKTHSTSTRSR